MNSPKKTGDTLKQQAFNYVKTQIMECSFRPGQSITDTQIAEELNMSRTPVREALTLLEQRGFLINHSGRGWKVYSLSLEDIKEIFEIRVELEGMLAKQASACTDKTKRSRLRNAIKEMKKATETKDPEAWLKADIELHDKIFSMANNKRAVRIIKDLNEQWYRIRSRWVTMEGRLEQSYKEHEIFTNYILEGDGDSAEKEMKHHTMNVRRELEKILVNIVLPFAQNGI